MSAVVVRADARLTVARSELSAEQVDRAVRECSWPNPERAQAERRGDPLARRLPERVCSVRVTASEVSFPAGRGHLLRSFLRGREIVVDDHRPTFAPLGLTYGGQLQPAQFAAVESFARAHVGLVIATPGFGKTEVGCAAIARVGLPALWVTHTNDLAEQSAKRISERLGVEPGFIGDGRFDVRPITVALMQSLTEERLEALAMRFGFLIADEAHVIASPTRLPIFNTLRVRYRLGLTATLLRTDGLSAFVTDHVGPICFRASVDDAVRAGRLTLPRYDQVRTAFSFAYNGPDDWHRLQEALFEDAARNELIADRVARECRGQVGVVLSTRIAHCNVLEEMLSARGLRARVVTGATKKAARSEALELARRGEIDVLISTQLFDEGVDVARLARVFLVAPSKSEGRMIQRIGRALRVHEAKAQPLVVDFADVQVGVLDYQAKVRAGIFRRIFGGAPELARAS